MSWELEEFVDQWRTKEEVVTETNQTGDEPVQSQGLWGGEKHSDVTLIQSQTRSNLFKIK